MIERIHGIIFFLSCVGLLSHMYYKINQNQKPSGEQVVSLNIREERKIKQFQVGVSYM